MESKKINIKNKIVNHLTVKGKKNKGEQILLKSIKKLQKSSKKASQKVFQLALVSATPIFKINKITQKKRKKKQQKSKIIPAFIHNKKARISAAIKYIIASAKKNKTRSFFSTLLNEFSSTAQYQSQAIETKKEIQKQASINKHLFKYYRWH